MKLFLNLSLLLMKLLLNLSLSLSLNLWVRSCGSWTWACPFSWAYENLDVSPTEFVSQDDDLLAEKPPRHWHFQWSDFGSGWRRRDVYEVNEAEHPVERKEEENYKEDVADEYNTWVWYH